jgi:hypothetical protein
MSWLATRDGQIFLINIKEIGRNLKTLSGELTRYNDGTRGDLEAAEAKITRMKEREEARKWGANVRVIEGVPYWKLMCRECKHFFMASLLSTDALGRDWVQCPFCGVNLQLPERAEEDDDG